MKIGVFDSGYGGLTVLARCVQACQEAFGQTPTFVYYADQDHAPYGERTRQDVRDLTEQAVRFLRDMEQVDMVIIACNTATSYGATHLRKIYRFPIIGIEPAIKPASQQINKQEFVLVTATPLMLQSSRLQTQIEVLGLSSQVVLLPLPELVRIAERAEGTWEEKQALAKSYLEGVIPELNTKNYGSVVLGCTHFPIFRPAYESVFQAYGQSPHFADGSIGVAKQLVRLIQSQNRQLTKESELIFYQSGRRLVGEQRQVFQELYQTIQTQFEQEPKERSLS